jgi:hypothetical protein
VGTTRPPPLPFETFCGELADALDQPVERVQGCNTAVSDLGLDELSLATLVLAVEELNPHFHLPDQADIHEITVPDIYHFYCVMTPNHREERDTR